MHTGIVFEIIGLTAGLALLVVGIQMRVDNAPENKRARRIHVIAGLILFIGSAIQILEYWILRRM